jgi:hypothetical protein
MHSITLKELYKKDQWILQEHEKKIKKESLFVKKVTTIFWNYKFVYRISNGIQ